MDAWGYRGKENCIVGNDENIYKLILKNGCLVLTGDILKASLSRIVCEVNVTKATLFKYLQQLLLCTPGLAKDAASFQTEAEY